MMTVAETWIEQLETERNVVENSFGNGLFQDGLLLARLNELDRKIARIRRAVRHSTAIGE